jgi:hypothetical protein
MTQTSPPHVSYPPNKIDVKNKAPILVFKGRKAKIKKKTQVPDDLNFITLSASTKTFTIQNYDEGRQNERSPCD